MRACLHRGWQRRGAWQPLSGAAAVGRGARGDPPAYAAGELWSVVQLGRQDLCSLLVAVFVVLRQRLISLGAHTTLMSVPLLFIL